MSGGNWTNCSHGPRGMKIKIQIVVEADSGDRECVQEVAHFLSWLYFSFSLCFRDVELLRAERGVVLIYETIRQSYLKFGQQFANDLRRRPPQLEAELCNLASNNLCNICGMNKSGSRSSSTQPPDLSPLAVKLTIPFKHTLSSKDVLFWDYRTTTECSFITFSKAFCVGPNLLSIL